MARCGCCALWVLRLSDGLFAEYRFVLLSVPEPYSGVSVRRLPVPMAWPALGKCKSIAPLFTRSEPLHGLLIVRYSLA
jgi:hypothetical protein